MIASHNVLKQVLAIVASMTKIMSQQNVSNEAEEEKQNEIQMYDIAKNELVPKTIPTLSCNDKQT